MTTFINILAWIWEHTIELIALYILFRYWRQIYQDMVFTPLAGGNGKIQMNEAAQGVILLVFAGSSYVEATRTTEYHIFSDAYYFALLGAVAVIAGLKHFGADLIRKGSTKTQPSGQGQEPPSPTESR